MPKARVIHVCIAQGTSDFNRNAWSYNLGNIFAHNYDHPACKNHDFWYAVVRGHRYVRDWCNKLAKCAIPTAVLRLNEQEKG